MTQPIQPTGQGTPPANAQPPKGQGGGGSRPTTGSGGRQSTADGFWGKFPTVPEAQRPLLEPHLREVEKHVTQLQQQYAPYKGFVEAGYTPQQVQGLLKFSQDFDKNPLQMWINLGNLLQQQGIVHQDLDVEYLAELAAGTAPPDDDDLPPEQSAGGQQSDIPPWAQQLQEELYGLKNQTEQERRQRREAAEDKLFDRQLSKMKEELKKAGIPEDLIDDKQLVASYIVHQGNSEAALQSITGFRDGLLKGFTDKSTQPGTKPLEMPNGAPQAPERKTTHRDGFAAASAAAEQALRSAQAGSAQD